MEKVLFVKYTPRHERSKSKELFDYAKDLIGENSSVDIIDLELDKPEFFDYTSVMGYILRNFVGQEIDEEQKKSLEKYDSFLDRFLAADKIIFAYPMYNFSMPGAVKTFIDMVMQKGKVFDITSEGYVPFCKDKHIIAISTAGGVYNEEFGTLANEHNVSLLGSISGMIGAKFSPVLVQGLDMMPEKKDELMQKAKDDLKEILSN